jgi:hypothetical protein
MAPFLPSRYVLQYFRGRLVNHLNAGKVWQAPDLLGQCAVCPLDNFLKAFGICGLGHEANFTTKDKRRSLYDRWRDGLRISGHHFERGHVWSPHQELRFSTLALHHGLKIDSHEVGKRN